MISEELDSFLISKYNLTKTDIITPENYRNWETSNGKPIPILNFTPGQPVPKRYLELIEILMRIYL